MCGARPANRNHGRGARPHPLAVAPGEFALTSGASSLPAMSSRQFGATSEASGGVSWPVGIGRLSSDDLAHDQGARRFRGIARSQDLPLAPARTTTRSSGTSSRRSVTSWQEAWIDSRELRGGDALLPEIPASDRGCRRVCRAGQPRRLQSRWLGKELRHALKIRSSAARTHTRSCRCRWMARSSAFSRGSSAEDETPLYVTISSAAGVVEAALHAILVALGQA